MKNYSYSVCTTIAFIVGIGALISCAREDSTVRDFDGEIKTELQSAKDAAGFEFLGLLSRLSLLPASHSANTSNNLPGFLKNPTGVPAREAWYANATQIYDNLFFVGGRFIRLGR